MTGFLRELKRRRVLHTVSLYVVGAWIALQVVEVLSGAGLPPLAMRNLLLLLSFGFPIALIIGWFFDISKEGITRTNPLAEGENLPPLLFFDHVLLVGLVLIMLVDIYILSFPSLTEVPASSTPITQQHTVAVLAFDDLDIEEGNDPVGDVMASEFRSALTRVAGLRVLGPETSKALGTATDSQIGMARELGIDSVVSGEVLLDGKRIQITTRLVDTASGDDLWSGTISESVGESIEAWQGLVRQIVGVIAPNLDPDPVQGVRLQSGSCDQVYDIYLRGKQLSQRRPITEKKMRERGVELLREAVSIDDQCSVAWEALAVEAIGKGRATSRYVKASALARRALKINEALPEAWTVLAEIAEEEARWSESEELFLHALYADPTNARANLLYGNALITRGRIRDALHYTLEAYRYEPADSFINLMVAHAAQIAGEGDLTIKYSTQAIELLGERHPYFLNSLAEGYLLKGETEGALEVYAEIGEGVVDWFPECVRLRNQPDRHPELAVKVEETLSRYMAGEYGEEQGAWFSWYAVRCGTWVGVTRPILDALIEADLTMDERFVPVFLSDAGNLRQHPRFYDLVTQYDLDDYWRQWGWSDYCKPDGDSFRCD